VLHAFSSQYISANSSTICSCLQTFSTFDSVHSALQAKYAEYQMLHSTGNMVTCYTILHIH
jgi:hypothetical protein